MTFLLGSAKADAQNATESVTAVHRANQPNLLNVLMEDILPLFSLRGKRNRWRKRQQNRRELIRGRGLTGFSTSATAGSE